MLRLSRALLFISLIAVALGACSKKREPSPPPPTKVSATRAYEKHFGPAPTTDKGTCYAFVIYFPSARETGKVVPFPFFTFDEASMKKVAVERLLGGMEEGSYRGEFIKPFAPGTRLRALTEENGTVTADFSGEILAARADRPAEKGLLNAIALTLAQFEGVKAVRILVEGTAGQPLTPDETGVASPSAPRVLSVTAVREKGEKHVEDLHVYFDRPVEIGEIHIGDKTGRPFEGEIYLSVFDMAAVLKPKAPEALTAGMPVRVRWKVVDKVGRPSEGESEFALEVREH